MSIGVSQEGGALTVYLKGDIDHHRARSIMLALDREIVARSPRTLTLDMGEVAFMDSSGLAVVLRGLRRMEETGGTIALCRVPAQAKKVFSAAGLDKLISMT